jgi:hypothetical protein
LTDAADWDCLAAAATDAGRLEEALLHAQTAMARSSGSRQFDRHFNLVELLLRLEKAGEATDAAKRWAAAPSPTPEQRAAMAELLAKYGRREPADELFAQALAAKDLAPQQRYGILCRRAMIHQGLDRWQILLDAADAVPADSVGRRQCLELVVTELSEAGHAEVAGQLAKRTRDPQLKSGLKIRQAELTVDFAVAADLYWQIYQAGGLAETNFYLAFLAWNHAIQPQRVVEVAELWLRSGKRFSEPYAHLELAHAYRLLGRDADAQRLSTGDPEPPSTPNAAPGRPRVRGAASGGMR